MISTLDHNATNALVFPNEEIKDLSLSDSGSNSLNSSSSSNEEELTDNVSDTELANLEKDGPQHPQREQLREMVLNYVKENPDAFHPLDIELLKKSNLWINRFLHFRNQSLKTALNHLISAFKWRKEFDINNMATELIPVEGWLSGAIFLYLPDVDGSPVIYLRTSLHHKVEEPFLGLLKKAVIFNLAQVDRMGGREFGWTCFFDLTGLSWSNIDLDFMYFLLSTMRQNFPNGCKWIIIYGLPWFANAIAKTVMGALPSDTLAKLKFVSGNSFPQMDVNLIPKYFKNGIGNLVSKINQDLQEECQSNEISTNEIVKNTLKDSNNNTENQPEVSEKDNEAFNNYRLSDAEVIKRLHNEELWKFIPRKNLPYFLGGTATINYHLAPKNSQKAFDILTQKFKVNEDKARKVIKPFKATVDRVHDMLEAFKEQEYSFQFNDLEEVLEKGKQLMLENA